MACDQAQAVVPAPALAAVVAAAESTRHLGLQPVAVLMQPRAPVVVVVPAPAPTLAVMLAAAESAQRLELQRAAVLTQP